MCTMHHVKDDAAWEGMKREHVAGSERRDWAK